MEIVDPVPHQYLRILGMPLIANDFTLLINHAATMTGEEIDCILDVILFDGEDVSHQIWTCTFYSHVISRLTYFHVWLNGVPIKEVDKMILYNTRY